MIKPSELASCSGGAKFSVGRDRNLTVVLDAVDAGIPALEVKYPGFKKPKVTYGLRGTRYFVEFPIINNRVEAFSYITGAEKTIARGKKEFKSRVTKTDSFSSKDNVSYMIDYMTESHESHGAFSHGSIYMRGVKSESYDSFKFVMEKNNDFCELDAKIILGAME